MTNVNRHVADVNRHDQVYDYICMDVITFKMTLYEFLQLNPLEQANAVWDKGMFMAHRNDD
ncbi:MAG TPA: hypothetical protein VGB63_11605 [Pedobacter sp.]